ncbi:TetR/AcrR family transcriptional regulator [Streptomyces xiaopingdaonensis]|uniref:TetR/AcrR family transcriptional regulator n=1 Tax=Streptomyces xiaopingdaonensis TaxID=1565415 RepID=UPI0002DEE62F|nr:TetR/AcrR family transcriptional regulator [Streptomyces xiaopingdaonensis]
MDDISDKGLSLRERKRQRTRARLIDAGYRLFTERGYDETTVADIAAAADIGTRTFSAYFETKEQLLFPEADPRVTTALRAIAERSPSETPAQVLLRGLSSASIDEEASSPVAQLRMRLLPHVPAVQARALRLQLEAQRQITAALREAFPRLEAVQAAALVGAFVGGVAAAFYALGESGDADERTQQVRDAVAEIVSP